MSWQKYIPLRKSFSITSSNNNWHGHCKGSVLVPLCFASDCCLQVVGTRRESNTMEVHCASSKIVKTLIYE